MSGTVQWCHGHSFDSHTLQRAVKPDLGTVVNHINELACFG